MRISLCGKRMVLSDNAEPLQVPCIKSEDGLCYSSVKNPFPKDQKDQDSTQPSPLVDVCNQAPGPDDNGFVLDPISVLDTVTPTA